MTIKVIISSAVISALITLIGSIITANISRKAAKEAAQEIANREIEKMKLTWQREDIISSDEEFDEMAAVVAKYVSWGTGAWETEAIEAISTVRAKEYGELGRIMDDLYACVSAGDMYEKANRLLSEAINEKRRIKSQAKDAPDLHHQ